MTTYAKGADPEALARIARNLKGMQTELSSIEAAARRAVRALGGHWGGGDLRSLVRAFDAVTVPGLLGCSGVLEAMARRLEENAAAQRSASGLGPGVAAPGLNDVTRTKGEKFSLPARVHPDSMGDPSGTRYRHTSSMGLHTYENATGRDDGRVDYDRYTHAGDHHGPGLLHEQGWRSETTHAADRPWLPRDDSDDPQSLARGHPTAATGIDRALGGITWMERTEHPVHSDYEPIHYDADGNVTDEEHAVRTAHGGGPGTEVKGHHEFGIKEGALAAGLGGTAGAYLLKGGVEGNLGRHGRYDASGFVGAEGKGDASVRLGKDGLAAQAKAEAVVGVKGEAGVAYDNGMLAGHARGSGLAGAEAKADASVTLGKDGLRTSAGAEAFAGAKVQGEVGGNIAGIGGTVGGEVSAGIGAHADIDANFSAESVKVKVDVGVAVGIGAGVKVSVDVNPKEFLQDSGLGAAADGVGSFIKDPASAIGGFFP